ncbi:MAG: hypothetical protein GX996_08130, partial [Firmicutes bacterium]|nr:hypothetical protein [Bacillota bacterium]
CIAIPEEIIEKRIKGTVLTREESEMFFAHPLVGAQLLSNIPRLKGIAKAIKYQFKQFDGGGIPADDIKGCTIPIISRILKVVTDFDTLKAEGNTIAGALEIMNKRSHWYDPDVLAALKKEIADSGIIRMVSLMEILPGMALLDDIRDDSGVVLVPKGSEITEVLKMRIFNYARFRSVNDKVKVLIPQEEL